MVQQEKRTLVAADAAIRLARKEVDWLALLPAQAAQALLKAYVQAWRNCWDGWADAPKFKARLRFVMSVDIPQGRDLHVQRVHRRWGMVNIPKVGRVRFRWTKDLPIGRRADKENRVTGARLVKDALGWHIAFRVQTFDSMPKSHPGPEVGIDVGITVPMALSDGGSKTHREWLTDKEQATLVRLERRPHIERPSASRASASPTTCGPPTTRSQRYAREPSSERLTGSTRPPHRLPGHTA